MEQSVPDAGGLLRIGGAAERTGLSIRTVRYWEEVGLVEPTGRTAGGFRLYSEADLERLETVKRMKPLDLTLEEMRELLGLLNAPTPPTREERAVAAERLESYAERSHQRAQKLEAYTDQARALRDTIIEQLDTLQSARGAKRTAG